MKTAARIVSAALALAALTASVATPFTPAAQAAAPANVEVVARSWDYQAAETNPGQTTSPNGTVRTAWRITNNGGSSSDAVLVWTWCGYAGPASTTEWGVAQPLYTLPGLAAGRSTTISFDCLRQNGELPTSAKVRAQGADEPDALIDSQNEQTQFFSNLGG